MSDGLDQTRATVQASIAYSEKIKEKINEDPSQFHLLTGDRPTGRLHLGHYFGTLSSRVELQNKGVSTILVIADYQVITDREKPENLKECVYNIIADYIAAGIDPEKTIIFTHSSVPALNELMLPFLSLVSDSELYRNPTVKSEQEAAHMENLSGLLLTYPVHQAADILFCKANIVPVGVDQLPHIEMTRQIARKFNNRYKDVFPEPNALLTETPQILGLDGRKMSKSYKNTIELGFNENETKKAINKAVTDSDRNITFDPANRPGVSALLTLGALTSSAIGKQKNEKEIATEIGDGGAGQLKQFVIESVNSYFKNHREKRNELINNMPYLKSVLQQGIETSNHIANRTLNDVHKAIGIKYF